MKIDRSSSICMRLLAAIVRASLGCIGPSEKPGPTQNESRSVPLGDAKSVNADVTMGVGRLTLLGGAKDLAEASFVYNVPSWKPEVIYTVTGGVGTLSVQQPSSSAKSVGGNVTYIWNLQLNNDVPINLKTTLGAGESNLILGNMSLTGLSVQSGAGNATVDMSGNWKSSLNASIKAGVGNLMVMVPKNTGAIVYVTQGIGSVEVGSGLKSTGKAYTNDPYGKSATNLSINIEAGIGKIRLAVGA